MRKAAQSTQATGGCQLNARRGKFGRRSSGGSPKSKHATAASSARKHGASAGSGHRSPDKGAARRADQPAASGAAVRHGAIVEGTISANRAGYGFLKVDGFKESIFLPPPEMRGVMHGDRLRVKVSRDATDRWSGTLEQVLERGVTAFLGTVELQGRHPWVNAADRRLQLRCAVAPNDLHGARAGDWVIARITRHAGSASPAQAVIEKRLDPQRPVELATESALARFSLPSEFAAQALREAHDFGEHVDAREANSRIDLRALPLVTIDGADARDFDDAVYAEPHGDGYRLIVAIADVSHYVRPGTAIDTAAKERGTSVYFPTRVVPMLPTALSDHLCSLAPHVDRLCFAADMLVSKNGTLRSAKFYPAVMRSAARLTYTIAHEALFEGRPAARLHVGPLLPKLMVLVDVYRALQKARARRGALDFDAPEAQFVIDSAEKVTAIELRARNDAHRLVEECMILANVAVAQELQKGHMPTLYRVHGQPDDEKLERLASTLRSLGIDAQIPQSVTTRDLQAIAQRVGDAPERAFVESLVIRAMPQAVYQPSNIGHFGLALTHYAHFTSPIRRYPDLVVHRTLKALIGAKGGAGVRYETPELSALGESTSRQEKRADEADRYVSNYLKCAYLAERVGQTFRGLITTVVEFGCFVQIIDVGVDGLLHLDNLRDDEYQMEDGGHAWRGRRSGRRLSTGSHINVVVTSVNPIEGLIDLNLAEEEIPKKRARR